jgi:hypothetical protein
MTEAEKVDETEAMELIGEVNTEKSKNEHVFYSYCTFF